MTDTPDIKVGDTVVRTKFRYAGGEFNNNNRPCDRPGFQFVVARIDVDGDPVDDDDHYHELTEVKRVVDAVNPAHYQLPSGGQLIDFVESLPFARGNAVKYLVRAGVKDPATEVEDLEKALWYVTRELDRVKSGR